jgi:hypothetical protein
MSKKIALVVVLVVLFLGLTATGAKADDIIASSTGLTSPVQTLTFDEIVLPMNTSLTTQYSGLGISFTPNVYYSPQTTFGNVQGNDIGNFTFNPDGPVNPVSFVFSGPINGAAFSFDADSTPYLFQAFLGGVLVDSFTATVGVSTSDYYGFNNITFDTIVITQEGAGGGPFWVADNIQFGSAVSTPEPASIALLGFGLFGLAAAKLRRKTIAL